jgi:hypothetical protein
MQDGREIDGLRIVNIRAGQEGSEVTEPEGVADYFVVSIWVECECVQYFAKEISARAGPLSTASRKSACTRWHSAEWPARTPASR